jgi:hypothetical protein
MGRPHMGRANFGRPQFARPSFARPHAAVLAAAELVLSDEPSKAGPLGPAFSCGAFVGVAQ